MIKLGDDEERETRRTGGERGGSIMAKAKRNRGQRIVTIHLKWSDRWGSTMKRHRR